MKLSKPFGALFLAASVAALFTSPTSHAVTADASATNTSSGIQVAPAPATEHPSAARFSPGAQEIVNMLEAKVDPEVIKAYIKNSPVPYNLSASEIIDLKSHGVPDDMLAAMLQRGTEIRAHAVASSQPGPVTTPAPYPMTSQYPPYQYPQYPEANYDYGTSYYAGYPYYYPYYYPYSYYWYNYGYPWYGYYYPFYYYPYCHFDGHGFCHVHNRFHNGHWASNGHWGSHGWNHPSPQGPNHSSAFGTFAGRNNGFSGTRTMGSFGTFAPQRSGFASAPSASRASMAFSAARPSGFAGHAGGFSGHVGGGFRAGGGGGGGRGGGGGHR